MYILFRIFYFLATIKILSKLWFIFYYLDFFRKPIVLKNLDIAFPNKSKKDKIKIAKNTYKNFLNFFEDIIEFKKNPSKLDKIKIINEEYILEAINSNRPIILMTAHFGNWEISPKLILKKYNKPLAIIMREIENEKINKFFKKIRGDEDIKLINKRRSSREIVKSLLKEKRILGILIDQKTSNKNAPVVDFFVPTKFNPAISKIAKSTNAIVIPGFCYKKDNSYIVEFKKPREFKENNTIEEFTKWQAKEIEDMIKKYPSQYYWFHDRWKV
ncbi:lysophospholipid acyltransferase family protein [Caminibacter mediatlanticus]|uniref:Lipid A biosynthesis lauroyl acyltransferase n=1 Tax=Caminibacter mediatlanticus TB-2 TaxID=391592 RepID=A0AAI9AGS4_9BACT|nr:lysophospholipid acyltransferase family protein [Caminibacter mediatlanticus]EDM23220.1 lipid A biosynthesis lauroyl acyltransferase [Caminibacter mediatlanticus TB-2]